MFAVSAGANVQPTEKQDQSLTEPLRVHDGNPGSVSVEGEAVTRRHAGAVHRRRNCSCERTLAQASAGSLRYVRIVNLEMLRCSCLCGGVQFEIASFEGAAFYHCTTCKKLSGGVGTANALVDPSSIRFITGRDLVRTYQPTEGTAKTFCSVCWSPISSELDGRTLDRASVRLPAIDSPFETRPQRHGFTQSRAPWETLPDDGLRRNS